MSFPKESTKNKFVFHKGSYKSQCAYMLMLIRQKDPKAWIHFKQEFSDVTDENSYEFYEQLVAFYRGEMSLKQSKELSKDNVLPFKAKKEDKKEDEKKAPKSEKKPAKKVAKKKTAKKKTAKKVAKKKTAKKVAKKKTAKKVAKKKTAKKVAKKKTAKKVAKKKAPKKTTSSRKKAA